MRRAVSRPLRSSPLSADAIDRAPSNKQRDSWRRRLEQFPNPLAAHDEMPNVAARQSLDSAERQSSVEQKKNLVAEEANLLMAQAEMPIVAARQRPVSAERHS